MTALAGAAPAGEADSAPAPASRGRWLRPALGVLVAGVFVWLTMRTLDWAAVRAAWRGVPPAALALALLTLAAGFVVRIVRWWWMLRVFDDRVTLADCARPLMASLAVNNTVPLRAGDVVRAFGFRSALRAPPAQVIGTLVVERVLDMVVLLGIFFVGLAGVPRGAVPAALVTAGSVTFALLLAAVLALMFAPRAVEALAGRLLLGPLGRRRWAARVHGAAGQFFASFTQLLTPGRAAQLLALSVVLWLFEGGMYATVSWALRTGAAPAGPWFAFATATLATLLPSSPGYVGTYDYFAILALTAYGAGRTGAAAFAIMSHVLLWLPPTVVGALCLVSLRRRSAAAGGTTPSPG